MSQNELLILNILGVLTIFIPKNFPSTGILCHTEVEFSENNIQNCSQFSIGVFSLFILQILWSLLLKSFLHWQFSFSIFFKCSTYIKHVQRKSMHCWLLK